MRYIEISARIAGADVEAACDALRELGSGGLSIEGGAVRTVPGVDDVAAAQDQVVVRVYAPDCDAQHALIEARRALGEAGVAGGVEVRLVAEEDWAESWKEQFQVERFGQSIVVVPSWRTYDATAGDAVIMLDPGMAFGTGQHETTRMCLEALERAVTAEGDMRHQTSDIRGGEADSLRQRAVRRGRVLDVGCGSGILAIAAAKLGADQVYALDLDENCVRVTAENVRGNGVDRAVRAAVGSVGAAWPFADEPQGRFDVVVANIVANTIVELAPEMVRALRVGGRLIVSGVIAERVGQVVDALERAGVRVDAVRTMGEWRCIEGTRE